MKLRVYSNSAFLLRAAIGFSRRVTSAGGRLLFFQSVFNLLLLIMHLFPSDRPPSILFAKKFRIHDSFIATPPQKMRGTLSLRTPQVGFWGAISGFSSQAQANNALRAFSLWFAAPG
jgi:hypothetical protein